MTDTGPGTPLEDGQSGPRSRRGRRFFQWSAGSLVVVAAALALGLALLIGRPLPAPDWLRDTVETRIAGMMRGGGGLELGGVKITLDRGLTPEVRLQNLTIRDAAGARLGALADARGVLSRAALMKGDLRVKTVELSGLQIALRRGLDGSFDLAFGQGAEAVDQAASLGDLLSTVDGLFQMPQHATIERISAEALTLRYEDARSGRSWVADGGRLLITQRDNTVRIRTDFAVLGGGADVAGLVMTYESEKGDPAAQIGITVENAPAQDIAVQAPALAWLEVLEAPISGSMRFGINQDASLGPLFGTLEIGAGALRPTDGTRPIRFDTARTYFTYDPTEEMIAFDEVAVRSETISALAEGRAYLRDVVDGWPETLLGQFTFNELSANPNGMFDTPWAFEKAAFDFRLRLTPFVLDVGQFVLMPPEGSKLLGSGQILAGAEGWDVALDGQLAAISAQEVMARWPVSLRPNTRKWFANNILSLNMRDLHGALRLGPGRPAEFSLGLDYSDGEVRYLRTLPPLQGAKGHAVLEGTRFTLVADEGYVTAPQGGRINVAGSTMEVPNLAMKDPPGRFLLATEGTITAGLSVLDLEPFEFLTKAGQPVTLGDGRMALDVDLTLPLAERVTPEQVRYAVAGTAAPFRSEQIMPGRVLASPGLEVRATPEGISVSGPARVDQVPITATWSRAFGSPDGPDARVEGTVELSERFADTFGLAFPAGTLSGVSEADFTITLPPDAPPAFTLSSALRGLGLRIPPLGWGLPRAESGLLEVAGRFGAPARIDRFRLRGAGLDAQGSVGLLPNGGLGVVELSRVQVGDWLDAPVTLRGQGRSRPPLVEVRGGTFDLRSAALRGGGGQGSRLTATLDRLIVSDNITLTDLRGEFSGAGGFNGSFTAGVNGGARINGTVAPGANGTAIRVRSDDAGATLRSSGLLRQARGGTLDLVLQPTTQPGSYDGRVAITNTRIQDAPALAGILSALSIVGLLDQMAVGGILFSNVDARFRLTPSQVIVQQSSAVGPSMGLSLDGVVNRQAGTLDMQGVLSPLYMVNALGSVLTVRRGEGLIGFNFTLRGPTAEPRVAVNPLSVFTPGMFREIFRRPPPQVTQ